MAITKNAGLNQAIQYALNGDKTEHHILTAHQNCGSGREYRQKCHVTTQKTICPTFSCTSYQIRNKWMVDHSSLVIGVFNGKRGGTRNTIDYAERVGVPCKVIREEKL